MRTSARIIHTADWHLGRNLFGTSLLSDQAAILDQFVEHVRDVMPDVVLIAGDVYDRSVPPVDAVDLLDSVLSRILMDLKVPVVMIAGNHDSRRRLTFGGAMMKRAGLHIPDGSCERAFVIETPRGDNLPIYGLHYEEPVVVAASLGLDAVRSDDHDTLVRGWLNTISEVERAQAIVMVHGFVAGGAETDSERPIHIGGAGQIGLDAFDGFGYAALGHLHRPQAYRDGKVAYAGGMMPFAFDETGQDRHAWLIEWTGRPDELPQLSPLPLCSPQPLKRISGRFHDLLSGEVDDARLCIELLDEGALFDAAPRLRDRFPNLLSIERPVLNLVSGEKVWTGDTLKKRGMVEMFQDFVADQREGGITERERTTLDRAIRDWQSQRHRDDAAG